MSAILPTNRHAVGRHSAFAPPSPARRIRLSFLFSMRALLFNSSKLASPKIIRIRICCTQDKSSESHIPSSSTIMASSRPTVFVCGATGFQGGAVARHLLKLQWGVHAVVRDLESKQALALSAAGAQLTKGDWDDPESIRSSMAGCSKMFFNLVVTMDDFDRERRQAVAIVDIARKAGVTQVVATTTLGVSCRSTPAIMRIV